MRWLRHPTVLGRGRPRCCQAGPMDVEPSSPEPTGPEATSTGLSGPRVEITYCTQCRWLLRAAWLGSELLTSFGTEIGEVALRPGTGGVFRVRVDDEVVWDRAVDGGFP